MDNSFVARNTAWTDCRPANNLDAKALQCPAKAMNTLFNTTRHGDGRETYKVPKEKSLRQQAEDWAAAYPEMFEELSRRCRKEFLNGKEGVEGYISVRRHARNIAAENHLHFPNIITPSLADMLIEKFPKLKGPIRRGRRKK
jgi:hypothetical protein